MGFEESQFEMVKEGEEIEAVERFFQDDYVEAEEDIDSEEEKEKIAKFKEGVRKEREKYQPTASEKIFAVVKSIIMRALAFYLIMWLFKRQPMSGPTTPTSEEDLLEDVASTPL